MLTWYSANDGILNMLPSDSISVVQLHIPQASEMEHFNTNIFFLPSNSTHSGFSGHLLRSASKISGIHPMPHSPKGKNSSFGARQTNIQNLTVNLSKAAI